MLDIRPLGMPQRCGIYKSVRKGNTYASNVYVDYHIWVYYCIISASIFQPLNRNILKIFFVTHNILWFVNDCNSKSLCLSGVLKIRKIRHTTSCGM